jgi:hypothetical protein
MQSISNTRSSITKKSLIVRTSDGRDNISRLRMLTTTRTYVKRIDGALFSDPEMKACGDRAFSAAGPSQWVELVGLGGEPAFDAAALKVVVSTRYRCLPGGT